MESKVHGTMTALRTIATEPYATMLVLTVRMIDLKESTFVPTTRMMGL